MAETTVTQLDAAAGGVWLVTTQGSAHEWDLDAFTYKRIPGAGRGSFAHDEVVHEIGRVERWPEVGSTFFVWFDDPENPGLEHWRQSSTIRSIERIGEKP